MSKSLLLLAVLLPASVAAQGLGDAAARERQKRDEKKASPPAKVFTEADLPAPARPADVPSSQEASSASTDDVSSRGARSASGEEGSAFPADPSKPVDSADRERQDRKLLEAEWRVRFANAREQIALAEAACWQEVVRTQFYNGVPVQMKVREFVESEEHRRAKAALADLQEEFRRTGLPPGWAREN